MPAFGASYFDGTFVCGNPHFGPAVFAGNQSMINQRENSGRIQANHHLFTDQKSGNTPKPHAHELGTGICIRVHVFRRIMNPIF